ncbi:MAG: efflux RND transporter permease subunit [Candidatus Hydrogenedentes bacterium]|nr:efflux RND transporter permease subunit [Candidatus Hydrogenedentota bacterium]
MSDPLPEREKLPHSLPIRRPVTMAMAFLTLVVFGWKSYQELPINLMPDISYPTLTVRTEYEGAAPEDVEKLVTRPLEEQLSIVSGLVELNSTSSAGLSEIVMEFTWGTDMNLAQQDVRDRLDLFDPPEEVTEKPVILRYDPTLDPVMRVAITGEDLSHITDETVREQRTRDQLTAIREAAERYMKSDLEAEMGIAQVLVKGGRELEVEVEVDADKLKNLGMSVETVVQALAQQNINLSGGVLREGKTEYLVRTVNEWEDVREIPHAVIGSVNGQPLRLSDVADVETTEKERESIVRMNGSEAVELQIFKWGDANTVRTCNTVKDLLGFDREKSSLEKLQAYMSQMSQPPPDASMPSIVAMQQLAKEMQKGLTLRNKLPEYSQFFIISDQSRFISSAIKEVQGSAINGGILAIIVLYFFLRELKPTVIMGVSIPISIIATFIPMFMQDLTLNIMSLGGLAMGTGMLVDNSIVVMESIFRCREEGDDTIDAANRGLHEVYGALMSSTLTSVAVFLPLAFVQGVAGQLFRDHALTVTYSLLASLIVALYLVPMIASRARLALIAKEDVVWLLRAYRGARKEQGKGRLEAALLILPNSALASAQWTLDQATVTFTPLFRMLKAPFDSSAPLTLGRIMRMFLVVFTGIIPILLVCLLFSIQCFIQVLLQVLITVLFFVTVVLVGVFGLAAGLLYIVLWVPLWIFDTCFNLFRDHYSAMLRYSLRWSPAILAIVLALAIHSATIVPTLGRELVPAMNQGEFGIRLEEPPGTRLEETARRSEAIERLAMQIPEVGTVAVEVGQEGDDTGAERGENIAEFSVSLKDPKKNVVRQDEIMNALREQIQGVSSGEVNFTLPSLFSFKTAIELQIRGEQYDELEKVGKQAVDAIRGVAGVKDPELSMKEGSPEIIIELDRDLLAAKGIAPEAVAQRLRTEVQGDKPTELNRLGEKIDIRVRADKTMLSSVNDLRKLSVTDGYPPIPLESVARISVQEGPNEIRRIDQRQVALVTANVTGRDLGAVMDDVLAAVRAIEMPRGYEITPGGQDRELRTAYTSLQFALILAVFLVYVVMACQFESILHPALVMTTVPMALIGVIYTLSWMSVSISILVYIGVICLAGIVVNNAIVLVDYINQLIDRGMKKADAVVEAGRVRLRPILMTTLTTVLGLWPMAVATGEGDEIRRPMAITIMAGLASSTILTLVIIPMVYYLFGGREKS